VNPFLAGLLVGGVVGFPLGIRSGKSYARALRAYRDWRATVQAIRGLRRRTAAQWAKAARHAAIAGGLLLLVVVVLVSAVTRG
jgi:predicted membrane chloride channel (bestrophin family)